MALEVFYLHTSSYPLPSFVYRVLIEFSSRRLPFSRPIGRTFKLGRHDWRDPPKVEKVQLYFWDIFLQIEWGQLYFCPIPFKSWCPTSQAIPSTYGTQLLLLSFAVLRLDSSGHFHFSCEKISIHTHSHVRRRKVTSRHIVYYIYKHHPLHFKL